MTALVTEKSMGPTLGSLTTGCRANSPETLKVALAPPGSTNSTARAATTTRLQPHSGMRLSRLTGRSPSLTEGGVTPQPGAKVHGVHDDERQRGLHEAGTVDQADHDKAGDDDPQAHRHAAETDGYGAPEGTVATDARREQLDEPVDDDEQSAGERRDGVARDAERHD